ncbi:hypothetical protein L208DRAFT_1474726 [Tricholoma matsutake]|nr:hypothetical protein L208DRAFT_1474726 [Tricholoma matsutake 945]
MYHVAAWMEAIWKLKKMQLLVALCAPNWKAKHVWNNTLLATHDSIANNSSDDAPQSDNVPSSSRLNKKKKEKDKRKKMKKEKDDDAMSITGSIPPHKPLSVYILMPDVSPWLPADHLGEHFHPIVAIKQGWQQWYKMAWTFHNFA